MKKFFRRKVSIFGKAIPISVILLFAVSVVAVAAFLLSLTGTVNLAASSIAGYFDNLQCDMYGGSNGTIDECTQNGSAVVVTASGLDDDSQIRVRMNIHADPAAAQTLHFLSVPPLGISSVICTDGMATPCEGLALAADSSTALEIYIVTGDLVPDQVVDEFTFYISAD